MTIKLKSTALLWVLFKSKSNGFHSAFQMILAIVTVLGIGNLYHLGANDVKLSNRSTLSENTQRAAKSYISTPFLENFNSRVQDDQPRRTDNNALVKLARDLQVKHGSAGFHVVVCEPFVVIGDETMPEVGARADQTVRWAVDHLRERYFAHDPSEIVTIWLFRDRDSYEKNCQEILGIKPHTPYGFYSSAQQVLVMNISTGGGTLVHEIVHPFMAANFPQCPAWFNEGLASLYEQSAQRHEMIWGLTNWRLRGLQIAVDQKRVPTFEELTRTTTREFYEQDTGTNYAQARYLCYYLQQQGKLQTFYREFKKNASDDSTGYKILTRILEITDWPKFENEWREYVLGLKFPESN